MRSMAGAYSQLFDSQASRYAEFRPQYPSELYDRLFAFCDFMTAPQVALDIAAGSGQASVELARTFKKVIAIDSNIQQLQEAKAAPNIEYRKGLAEETGVLDRAVDLVTVAQALHWFDFGKLWAEAARVLKPGGTFAAWGYGLAKCQDNQQGTDAIANWAYADDMLGPYWSPRRRHIDEEYASIEPDPALFEKVTRSRMVTSRECTISFFVNYLSTFSAYSTYRQRHPEKEDPIARIKQDLMAAYATTSGDFSIVIEFQIFLLMAKTKT